MQKELLEFTDHGTDTVISVNIVLETKEAEELKELWFTGLDGCQPPLVEARKNGLSVFIPWIMKNGDTL